MIRLVSTEGILARVVPPKFPFPAPGWLPPDCMQVAYLMSDGIVSPMDDSCEGIMHKTPDNITTRRQLQGIIHDNAAVVVVSQGRPKDGLMHSRRAVGMRKRIIVADDKLSVYCCAMWYCIPTSLASGS